LSQPNAGLSQAELTRIIVIPVSKPKACETAVTANAWYFLDNLPPKKSAVPHKIEDNSANKEAIWVILLGKIYNFTYLPRAFT